MEDDPNRSVQCYQEMLQMLGCWDTDKPNWAVKAHTQYPQKLNVWAGIIGGRILGPYLFEETLSGNIYLDFLHNDLVLALGKLFSNSDDSDIPANEV
ncbi:hypothetical protein ILUMI_16165 [Ignelater luminosus]|uniref:Uncharacterized protein n=1 Tax=Ignelater luminosus TaxID=2038154 RepID=A0A8K0G975_IGNLU|nr:hypothetical protein ILUMI_16165 [Ignelater luminosus]